MMTLGQRASVPTARCVHQPACPSATAVGRLAAVVVASHPEQGWNLLCNGVITFEDTGAIADGQAVPPRRAAVHPSSVRISITAAA
jgi:hypothetical protein